jgi:flagellar biosynthesis protein FlhB
LFSLILHGLENILRNIWKILIFILILFFLLWFGFDLLVRALARASGS